MSVSALKTEIRIQNIKLRRKDAENKKLREALRVLITQNESEPPSERDEPDQSSQTASGSDEEMVFLDDGSENEDEDDEVLPEPIFSNYEDLYFCTQCISEVVDGVCHRCGEAHQWLVDETAQESVSTETQAIHPDRSLVPRGNTPLREIGIQQEIPAVYCASHYPVRRDSREKEYMDLLKRGATRLMCETFHLEFSYDEGIYAWADDDLFQEFSGSLMRPGDFWKIHLGRRIALDEADEDGSVFMEGLLEDVLMYPYRSLFSKKTYEKWETVEESPGIWVTRLQATRDSRADADEDEDDSMTGYVLDYESDEWDALCAREDKDLENPTTEEAAILQNQYSTSDDDSEQADLEMDHPGLFNPDGPDAAWDTESQVDQLVDDNVDDESQNVDVQIKQESGDEDGSGDDPDSDEAGSDFDSDEVLSGDEDVIARLVPNIGRGD